MVHENEQFIFEARTFTIQHLTHSFAFIQLIPSNLYCACFQLTNSFSHATAPTVGHFFSPLFYCNWNGPKSILRTYNFPKIILSNDTHTQSERQPAFSYGFECSVRVARFSGDARVKSNYRGDGQSCRMLLIMAQIVCDCWLYRLLIIITNNSIDSNIFGAAVVVGCDISLRDASDSSRAFHNHFATKDAKVILETIFI